MNSLVSLEYDLISGNIMKGMMISSCKMECILNVSRYVNLRCRYTDIFRGFCVNEDINIAMFVPSMYVNEELPLPAWKPSK